MGTANILLIVFVIALAVLALWWAFNTIRQIQLQKEFAAVTLTSVAKLWKKTQYVPEDARDRESLYLYRDFLAKFDDDKKALFPLLVKDGNVRCMTRREYDRACHQRDKKPISWLVLIATVVYAVCAVAFNTKNLLFGLGLAAIMPVWVVVLAIFVGRFNKDKNNYREKLFATLQGNCADFLRLTKPYIVVDAYPQKFGKNIRPRYVATGTLTDEQIADTKNFIIRQKAAETEVVTRSVDNQYEINKMQGKIPQNFAMTTEATPTLPNRQPATPPEPPVPPIPLAEKVKVLNKLLADGVAAEAKKQHNDYLPKPLSVKEKTKLLEKLVHDGVVAEAERAKRQAAQAHVQLEEIKELAPLTVGAPTADANADAKATPDADADAATPTVDEDDFSLDSIGLALDAELAKRRNKK